MVKKTRQQIEQELDAVGNRMIQEEFMNNFEAYYDLLEERVHPQERLKELRARAPDVEEGHLQAEFDAI
jgi:hypothetical protein